MLAEEIIVHLGTLVRTEPKLFVEMFRLRIGLIIQVRVCACELNAHTSVPGAGARI